MIFEVHLELAKNPTIRLSRPQGTELMGFERQFERILAIRVDVFVASRREVGQIAWVDREPLGAQLVDGGLHVHRIQTTTALVNKFRQSA
mgnify:CR=1 FL=1